MEIYCKYIYRLPVSGSCLLYERTAGVKALFVSAGIIVHVLTPIILVALSSDPALKIRPTLSLHYAQRNVRTDDDQIAPTDSCRVTTATKRGEIDGLASYYKPVAGKRNLIGLYDNFN